MQAFIHKNYIILLSTVLGCIVATVIFLREPIRRTYGVVYEFHLVDSISIPSVFHSDTLFSKNSLVIRNFKTSYYDVLQEQGIRRGELKLYSTHEMKPNQIEKFVSHIDESGRISPIKVTTLSERKKYLPLLLYPLLGIFIGIVLEKTRTVLKQRESAI